MTEVQSHAMTISSCPVATSVKVMLSSLGLHFFPKGVLTRMIWLNQLTQRYMRKIGPEVIAPSALIQSEYSEAAMLLTRAILPTSWVSELKPTVDAITATVAMMKAVPNMKTTCEILIDAAAISPAIHIPMREKIMAAEKNLTGVSTLVTLPSRRFRPR